MTIGLKIIVCLLLFMEHAYGDDAAVGEAEEALRKTLLQNYDKTARPSGKPVIHFNSLTIINLKMHEADHTLQILGWLWRNWTDTRLKWNAEEHMNIQQLGMDPDLVWQPDLTIYNSAAADKTSMESQLPMLIYPTGVVLFVPAKDFHATCIMDVTYWPHDTHNCSIKVGSWIHSGFHMELVLDEDFKVKNEIPSINVNGLNMSLMEWEITATSASRETKYYECCEEPYISILITLLITRNAPAFAWTIKLPAICISILTIVVFLLPPGAGEKLVFGGLCLFLDLLYITYTSRAVEHAPSHTPLIVQLVCQQLVLLLVSVVVCAIVVRISRDPHLSGLPPALKGPITGLAYVLCLGNYANLSSGSYSTFARTVKQDEVELGDECNRDSRKKENVDCNDWLMFGAVVDRLCFILYTAICIISLIRFSSIL